MGAIVLLWLADDFFAEPGLQDLGNLDGSVRLLMVFHDRYDGSADRDGRAVKRVNEVGSLFVLVLVTDV